MAVTGLQRLNRKLTKEIPQKVYDGIRAAMEAQANAIVAQMKAHAPVDTGDLQMSINWTWGNAPKGAIVLGRTRPVRARSGQTASDGLRITLYAGGNDQYYAWFQEFGRMAGDKEVPAQPFFYPVYRANKRRAKAAVTKAVSKGVKEGAR